MFSQTVEYALRAVTHLAYVAPEACRTQDLAQATKVPQAYLSKVLQGLVRSEIIKSQRGIGGGVSLLKRPDELTIYDIITAVDSIPRIHSCPLGISSHGTALCPLHRRLDDAAKRIETQFREVTLAEILEERGESKPLCESHEKLIVKLSNPKGSQEN